MMPLMGFVGNLGYVVVCILGGFLAVQKAIQVGDILAFIQYVRSFNQPITQVASIANVLQSTMAAAERVFDFLEEEEEIPEAETPAVRSTPCRAPSASTMSSFGYSPDKIIIKTFPSAIKPGQKVAIVGPTGAGKTTIVKLLMRFYDVNSGAITDRWRRYPRITRRNDLRGLFGMVLQDTWLFNGTIRENIRYGRTRGDR